MALIRIFGKDGFTGLFYIRVPFQKNSLVDLTQDKMTIYGHIISKFGKMWV